MNWIVEENKKMKVFFHKIFILIRNLAIFHFVFLIYFGLVYLALNIVFYIFEAITRTIFDYSLYKNYMIDLNSSEITLIAVPTVIFFLREFFLIDKVFIITYNPFSSTGKEIYDNEFKKYWKLLKLI